MESSPSREIRSDDSSRTRGNDFLTTDAATDLNRTRVAAALGWAQHFSAAVSTCFRSWLLAAEVNFRPAGQFFRSLRFQHQMAD